MPNSTDALVKAYEDLGKRWLAGAQIEAFNCSCYTSGLSKEEHLARRKAGTCTGLWLTDNQAAFVNDKHSELLVSGGYRSGKTVGLIVKMYLLSMFFPNNRILLGRKSRSDIDSTLIPAIMDIFPPGTYEYKVGPGRIEFPNGSQILLYGLDTAVSGDDTKKATQKIRGLDLGAVFIDQLEEVEEVVWEQLTGRMSRNVPFRQRAATTNPARFWAFDYFKQNPRKGTFLIETGMADNKDNLPDGFIEEQLEKGDMYVRRFVHGIWDTETMVEGRVFSSDVDKDQMLNVKQPIREIAGVKIFLEPVDHEYQIGIDPSIGAEDPCAIVCVDTVTGDVVATFSGFLPTNAITLKALIIAEMYSKVRKPLIIPEATGVGQALIEDLKKQYERIYEREVFSKREKKTIDKLGFYTNYATKIQLIENMGKLFQSKWPKLRDRAILEEIRAFVWSDEAKKQGAGAPHPYHDDRVMAMMLAFYGLKPRTFKERNILENRQERPTTIKYEYN
jgi:hypothetical protein